MTETLEERRGLGILGQWWSCDARREDLTSLRSSMDWSRNCVSQRFDSSLTSHATCEPFRLRSSPTQRPSSWKTLHTISSPPSPPLITIRIRRHPVDWEVNIQVPWRCGVRELAGLGRPASPLLPLISHLFTKV